MTASKRVATLVLLCLLGINLFGCEGDGTSKPKSSEISEIESSSAISSDGSQLKVDSSSSVSASNSQTESKISLSRSETVISKVKTKSSSVVSQSKPQSSQINSNVTVTSKFNALPSYEGKSAKILILGNCFVDSSRIGEFTDHLAKAKGKKLEVEAVSRGYYEAYLYFDAIAEFPKITEGYYDAIFISGYYSYKDPVAIGSFANVVKGTKTNIVVFPSDREFDIYLGACTKYNVPLVGWRETLQKLLSDGFDTKIENDDTYLHCDQLEGFIGACVIYSALYKSKPNDLIASYTALGEFANFIPGSNKQEQDANIVKIEDRALEIVNLHEKTLTKIFATSS